MYSIQIMNVQMKRIESKFFFLFTSVAQTDGPRTATRSHQIKPNRTHDSTYEPQNIKITHGQWRSIIVVKISAKYNFVFLGTFLADTLREPFLLTKRFFLERLRAGNRVCWSKDGEEHGVWSESTARFPWRFDDRMLTTLSEENGSILTNDSSALLASLVSILRSEFVLLDAIFPRCLCMLWRLWQKESRSLN